MKAQVNRSGSGLGWCVMWCYPDGRPGTILATGFRTRREARARAAIGLPRFAVDPMDEDRRRQQLREMGFA